MSLDQYVPKVSSNLLVNRIIALIIVVAIVVLAYLVYQSNRTGVSPLNQIKNISRQ